ncbi:uncharacterized protein AMSG_09434 [Thecamonas trahens ATCC 50062]|uniref:STAS domain-containing protein n=1 Tax=Thecamonas trahens ATCC 50062 TaxID=461836 RepID=A0A0L0DLC0_THETB|nr:hypothetical protein AMSG_09434 [Thecamonas trahens ATCC 50062]KNC53129.1 hypothetical protein AMSG_09434 [Thecamonas trahens ATCC 50062]|eukprot:XP_013754796.1 hypothetical protein AMSG_09434 [Thecamonas trahens ATCC 50062]
MGFVTVFLSPVLVSGFTTAGAVLIATSQLKHVFQVHPPPYDGFFDPVRTWVWIARHLGETNVASLVLTLAACILLVGIDFVNKRFKGKLPIPIPAQFVVLGLGLLASYALDLEHRFDVSVVGTIPAGFPAPRVPTLSGEQIEAALVPATVLAVVSFAVSISIGKTFAKEVGYVVRPNQELLGLGVSNVVGSVFFCYPACGSLSRSVVTAGAGGVTPVNALLSSAVVAIIVAFATKPFEITPQAVLAAIILVALKRLFLQARELPALFKVKKADGLVWAFVFVAVLGLGVSNGLVAGVLFSLAVVVYKQLRPYTAVLGRFRGTRNYGPVARFGAETSEWPRIKVVFYGADLFYGNVGRLASSIDAFVDEAITDYVVLDLSAAADADITAIKALAALRTELAGRGVTLFISHPHKRILSLLAALRLDELPDDILFTETHDACLAALAALESAASVTQQPQQPLPSSSPSLPQPRAVSGRVITNYGSIQ